MKIGYARVSTLDQSEALQIDALTAAHCERIYVDKMSGTKKERPELDKMLASLRSGDMVVVWKIDRLGRSLLNLAEIAAMFEQQGVGIISVTQGIDTSTAAGRMFFGILAVIAEFEHSLISERIKAGLDAVKGRPRGKGTGRPKALNARQIATAQKLYDSRNHTVAEIAEMMKCSASTIKRYVVLESRKVKVG